MKRLFSILLTILVMMFGWSVAFATEITEKDIEPMEEVEDIEVSPVSEAPEANISAKGVVDESTHKTVDEDGQFATAGDLYQHWMATNLDYETSPYPAYICGVYSTDGGIENLTFAVTKDEAGEAGKAEILALVSDKSTVSFTYQSYPHAELWAIQLELTPYLGDETGANSLGIQEIDNVLVIGINEENKNAETFMASCFEKYGDRIKFELNDGIFLEDSSFRATEDKGLVGSRGFWYLAIALMATLFVGILFISRHRFMPAMQTNSGGILTGDDVISTYRVKGMVKEAKITPPTKLDTEILSKIEKM